MQLPKTPMIKLLRDILRLLRPRQWIKNSAIFGALLFSGQLFDGPMFFQVSLGFLIFCALSSSIYIINDMFDIEKDRLHPFKRLRPLANNEIPIPLAMAIAAVLAVGSLVASFFVNPGFFAVAIIYFILHVLYSLFLKHI